MRNLYATPKTVEAFIRWIYRRLTLDDRLLLASDPGTWNAFTLADFLQLRSGMRQVFAEESGIRQGNQDIIEDIRRGIGRDANYSELLTYLFQCLVKRARVDAHHYPRTVKEAMRMFDAELGESDHKWFLSEKKDECGLIRSLLEDWCIRRFGLDGVNGVLINRMKKRPDMLCEPFEPRAAAQSLLMEYYVLTHRRHYEMAHLLPDDIGRLKY